MLNNEKEGNSIGNGAMMRILPVGYMFDSEDIRLQYKPFESFNSICSQTIDNCLYALFNSNNFEESITKILSYGYLKDLI